ncbi:MAG: biotin--[acetyl-CoA-carboxylase] ligase [Thermoanaerobaculia bacterium]|nr:biotin--[acetyl-CoA-carboxylase] ligase [Thermoanaerobaculia bacterium]
MIDTRKIVSRLRTIESLAVIPRVASTNLVARRIVNECVDNELSLPQAMIIAREQFAGRGRNQRSWSSPAGKGIYATTMLTRPAAEMPLVPLQMAVVIATFLRENFAIQAEIKWPNDVLAGGKKIAGILIEARVQEGRGYMLIGTGINVEPVKDDSRPNATSIREAAGREVGDLDDITRRFIEHVDAALSESFSRDDVLANWRSLTVHREGDPISCVLGDRTVAGTWNGVDEHGRALLKSGSSVTPISAGDIILGIDQEKQP